MLNKGKSWLEGKEFRTLKIWWHCFSLKEMCVGFNRWNYLPSKSPLEEPVQGSRPKRQEHARLSASSALLLLSRTCKYKELPIKNKERLRHVFNTLPLLLTPLHMQSVSTQQVAPGRPSHAPVLASSHVYWRSGTVPSVYTPLSTKDSSVSVYTKMYKNNE